MALLCDDDSHFNKYWGMGVGRGYAVDVMTLGLRILAWEMEERRRIFGLHRRQQETDHRGTRPFESRETLKKDVARGGYHMERNVDDTVKKPKQLYEDEGEDDVIQQWILTSS